MKKIILLLSLYFMTVPAFSQNIIFQDNFEKGRMNPSWVYGSGHWTVANLESISMLPSPQGNNFALSNNGTSVISIDIGNVGQSASQTQHLNFFYRVRSKDAKGTVELSFFDQAGNSISAVQFTELREMANWTYFNEEFKIPAGTNLIRLKFGFHTTHSPITVYYQNVCIGCSRKGS